LHIAIGSSVDFVAAVTTAVSCASATLRSNKRRNCAAPIRLESAAKSAMDAPLSRL